MENCNVMQNGAQYVLVTPVKDEAATIGKTIASVISQTIRPSEWVIVSDGSTDGTDDLVRQAAIEHPWIRLICVGNRATRSFAAVVHNTETGIASLLTKKYDFLGLLDGDLAFQSDYFQILIQKFAAEPLLGLIGGVAIDIGQRRDRFPRSKSDVPGAVQFFRRNCFESLGGLLPIPEGGWDAMTCVTARMNGFQTRLCTDLIVDHLKPRNISQGGALRRKWQMGERDWVLGYHPLFELLKCLGRLKEAPVLVGTLSWWLGYCTAAIRGTSTVVPRQIREYLRKEQRERLWRIFRKDKVEIESVTKPSVACASIDR